LEETNSNAFEYFGDGQQTEASGRVR